MPLFRRTHDQNRDRAGRYAPDTRGARIDLAAPAAPGGTTPLYATDTPNTQPASTFEALLAERLMTATVEGAREMTVTEGWDGDRQWVSIVTPTCQGSVFEAEDGIWRASVVPAAVTAAPRLGGPFRTKAEARDWAERETLARHLDEVRARVVQDTLTELDGTAGA